MSACQNQYFWLTNMAAVALACSWGCVLCFYLFRDIFKTQKKSFQMSAWSEHPWVETSWQWWEPMLLVWGRCSVEDDGSQCLERWRRPTLTWIIFPIYFGHRVVCFYNVTKETVGSTKSSWVNVRLWNLPEESGNEPSGSSSLQRWKTLAGGEPELRANWWHQLVFVVC